MKERKHEVTAILLLVNMLFWIRLLVLYINRFAADGESIYIVIAVLLFLDMTAYGMLAFGLSRDNKLIKILLIPFLVANAVLSVTDDVGFWDIAALLLNLVTMMAYILEHRASKKKERR